MLTISGLLPDHLRDAAARVTLERPLTSLPVGLEKLPLPSPENREVRTRIIVSNHERANSFILASSETRASGKRFAVRLAVPAELPWTNLIVRGFATLNDKAASGVLALPARPSATGSQAR
jgi:hypothetical protein